MVETRSEQLKLNYDELAQESYILTGELAKDAMAKKKLPLVVSERLRRESELLSPVVTDALLSYISSRVKS